jgi:DNA polymerase
LDQLLSAKKTTTDGQKKAAGQPVPDPASLALLTLQLRSLLACHRELGIAAYPADPVLQRVFAGAAPIPSRGRTTEPADGRTRRESAGKQAQKSPAAHPGDNLEAIAGDVTGCRLCKARAGEARPGYGSGRPRLVVIGDHCTDHGAGEDIIWGVEEDAMFWKMMAAIGLDRDSVYVTNVVKCHQGLDGSCRDFLQRELAVLQPPLICTMGLAAAQVLLGGKQPLHRLRGRFHNYTFPHGGTARVMPTYHPRFLLEQPDMKRVTWLDLQAIQRQLQGGR